MAESEPLDDETVELIACQAETDARLHPGVIWAVGMRRCVLAIRHLQAELEMARMLK